MKELHHQSTSTFFFVFFSYIEAKHSFTPPNPVLDIDEKTEFLFVLLSKVKTLHEDADCLFAWMFPGTVLMYARGRGWEVGG